MWGGPILHQGPHLGGVDVVGLGGFGIVRRLGLGSGGSGLGAVHGRKRWHGRRVGALYEVVHALTQPIMISHLSALSSFTLIVHRKVSLLKTLNGTGRSDVAM